MECPACNSTLMLEERLGITLDRCPNCHGIWFDSGELDAYRQRLQGASVGPKLKFAADQNQPRYSCPSCGRLELVVGNFNGRSLRYCHGCRGIFVPARTIEEFRLSADDVVAEGLVHIDADLLTDIVGWLIEGLLE